MKSNLAQKSEMNNEISVHPSTLKKLERQAMSEKFSLGYVQSSQLYRKEVYPFLSDAARHVYFELESKINGFQKESDFVSYSQLQGNTDIEGARVVARASIAKGLKELIKHGVISVLGTSKKGNKYQINEVSLLGKQYTKKTSSPTELVHVVDQSSLPSRPQLVHVVDTQKKDLKKYIKNTHTQGNALQNDDAWKPENSFLKTLLCQTKFGHQTDEILSMSDFQFHLGNFNAHWENKTYLTENQKHRKFASWLIQEFEKAERSVKAKTRTSEKPSRNVNDAWDSIPQFQGEVAPVEIPEDFV
jgi:hypothetical protein